MGNRKLLIDEKEYYFEDKNNNEVTYQISKCIGRGASSLVYEVYDAYSERGRLKEFYPSDINVERNEEGILVVDESNQDEFKKRLDIFTQIMDKRSKLIDLNSNIRSTMPEYCELLRGRNTAYIFQSYTQGICYSDISGESIEDIFRIAIELVISLKCYHDIGYVHLDIKPENMLISDNGNNIRVHLFDYETATSIEELKSKRISFVPYTENYCSPEHKYGFYDRIDIHSDVYSVGIILFQKMMGRFPEIKSECTYGAIYDYDMDSPIFKGVPWIIQRYLNKLFSHTIRVSEEERYHEDDEFINILKEILEFIQKDRGIIKKDNYKSEINEFYGRDGELIAIENCMKNKSILLIHGMGGIGKSELVKFYLTENEDRFGKIIYIEDTGSSVRDAINNEKNVSIEGVRRLEGISDDEFFENKVDIIKEECDKYRMFKKDVVIVFDNTEFFVELKDLQKLKETGCKIIVISRDPWEGIYFEEKMEVGRIDDENEEIELFLSHLEIKNLNNVEKEAVVKILNYYEGHPLLLELIAKSMNASGTLPSEMLSDIEENGIGASGSEDIRFVENGIIRQEKIGKIVYDLFKIYDLSEEDLSVLRFMALLNAEGIEKSELKKFLGTLEIANKLVGKGIIRTYNGRYNIHPIIKEMVLNCYTKGEECVDYIKKIKELLLESNENRILSSKQIELYVCIGINLDKMHEKIDDDDFYKILGSACQQVGLGEYAIKFSEKNVELQKRKYGEASDKTAISCIQCGKVLQMNGDYYKCLKKLELPVVKVFLPSIWIEKNLGKIAKDWKKKFDKLSKVILNNKKKSKKQLEKGKLYCQLAIMYCENGKYIEASDCWEKAWEHLKDSEDYKIKRELLGIDANIKFESGEIEKALECYENMYYTEQKLYQYNTEYYIDNYFGMAKCRYMLRDYNSSLKYITKAMELSEEKKGYDSVDTAKIYYYAAKINIELQNHKETMMYFDQSLRIAERNLGKKHSFTLLVKVEYMYYQHLNKKNIIKDEDYILLKENVLSKERPNTVTYKDIYIKMKEFAKILQIKDSIWDKKLLV